MSSTDHKPFEPSDGGIDAIIRQYIETALWSTPDPDGPQAVQDAEFAVEQAESEGTYAGATLAECRENLARAEAKVDEGHGEMLDEFYSMDDLHPSALAAIRAEVEAFVLDPANGDDLRAYVAERESESIIGHDFSLTKDRHGAGFWDRGLGEVGDRLTEAARQYTETGVSGGLYPGDDGVLYVAGSEPTDD